MLTMSEDLDGVIGALRDGASGYLIKGADAGQIEHAIRAVASGEAVVDHSLLQPMTELIHARRTTPARPFPQLSGREFDILVLMAQGLDNTAIARHLVLSPKTVRNHVSNVFAKIDAPDRPGAIVLAHRHGLGE
jgi:DNA-binding NarL/FixJ family response regulator